MWPWDGDTQAGSPTKVALGVILACKDAPEGRRPPRCTRWTGSLEPRFPTVTTPRVTKHMLYGDKNPNA